MAIWSSTGQDKSLVVAGKEPTTLEVLESLQVGDWLHFCPCIYDRDNDYVKVTAVKHTDKAICFDYIYISTVLDGDLPANFYHSRATISDSGRIDEVFIRKVDQQELVDFINNQINNVAAELWQYLGEKK